MEGGLNMTRIISRKPMPGDIVVADRIIYKHYGIYAGEGRVIHFAAQRGKEKDPKHAKIIESSLASFLKDSPVLVEESDDQPAFPSDQVVENARARLGEKGYSILTNNCEHFANECKYGVKKSRQVDAFLKMAGMAVLVIGVPLVGEKTVWQEFCRART